MTTRPSRRLLASVLVTALGASLAVARCVAPPGGMPKPDAGGPQGDAALEDAADAEDEARRKARLARIVPLVGATRVQVVSLSGPIDDAAAQGLARELRGVRDAEAVLLELDSVGGVPGAVEKVRDTLGVLKGPLVIFVRGQALGEAALLPFAAQVVVLAPGARWGAVSPTQFTARRMSESERAALAETFKEAARVADRPGDWAAAMVLAPAAKRPVEGSPATPEVPEKAPAPRGGEGDDLGTPAPSMAVEAVDAPKALKAPKAHKVPEDLKPPQSAKDPKAGKPPAPPAGALVTLGAREAVRLGLAELVRADLPSVVHRLGWAKKEVLRSGKALLIPQAPDRGVRAKKDPEALVRGTKRIVVVPISGTIELGLRSFVLRVLGQAKPGDLVVLDIDTFGGRVDAATQIRDGLLRTKAKTVALVNPRAISAGALISLACDLIVMVPGGSIGAATPVQVGGGGEAKPVGEKVVSYLRKEFKATAEAKGRRGDIAEAMVDMSVEVEDVPEELKSTISGLQKGKLLTLTTEEALALKMAELKAQSFDDFVAKLKLADVPVVRPRVNWAEEISRFLTGPVVSGLLMTIGILGLLLELYTPGFGVSGVIGLCCLLLFFFGHKIAGLAGWEPMLLFVVGTVLLFVEVFLTPGFGVLGSLGVLSVVGALVWTLAGPGGIPVQVSWEAGYFTAALVRVFVAVILVAVLLVAALRFIPRGSGPFRRLVLSAELTGDAAVGAHELPAGVSMQEELLGRRGVTETALRPTGQVRLGSRRIEVESRGAFVEKGVPVEVVEVEGRRIVVKALKEDEA